MCGCEIGIGSGIGTIDRSGRSGRILILGRIVGRVRIRRVGRAGDGGSAETEK